MNGQLDLFGKPEVSIYGICKTITRSVGGVADILVVDYGNLEAD